MQLSNVGAEHGSADERRCESAVPFVPYYLVQNLLTAVKLQTGVAQSPESALERVLREIWQFDQNTGPDGQQLDICGFQGEHGPGRWVCPKCGTEHEKEIDG